MPIEHPKIAISLLVRSWFKQLNDHAPIENLLNLLDINDLEMKFPDDVIHDKESFEQWYNDVTHKFFDQVHELKNIEIELHDNEATVTIYVVWKAHTWKEPDAYSKKIDADAFQVWKVIDKERNGKWKIKSYTVESLVDNI